MKEHQVGVAIAGLGFGLSVHLPAVRSNQNIKPVALWHPDKEKLNKICQENNLDGFNNWDELLNNNEIEAVIIATPPAVRYQLALEAIKSGKHVLLEKPVSLNYEEVSNLHKLSLSQRIIAGVDFEYRAVPLFMQAKQLIDDGFIGDPWLVKLDWIMSSRSDMNRGWNWYSDKNLGGGVLGALGTHAFDMLHWFFGQSKNVCAYNSTAIKDRKCAKESIIKQVSSEDIALIQIELTGKDGLLTIPSQVTLSSVSKNGRGFWLEIYGSEGTLILGSENQKDYVHGFGLWCSKKGESLRPISANKKFAFNKSWSDGRIAPVSRIQKWWAESIYEQKPMIPGLAEGAASQKVLDKCHESSKTGQRQNIHFLD